MTLFLPSFLKRHFIQIKREDLFFHPKHPRFHCLIPTFSSMDSVIKNLRLWLVTCPDGFSAEYEDIEEMFRRGLSRLILDKKSRIGAPRATDDEYERWLMSLDMEYRDRIWVRGTPDLAERLDVRGCVADALSLMGDVPECWKRVNCIALCNSLDEYNKLPDWVSGALIGPFYQPLSALEIVKTLPQDYLKEIQAPRIRIIGWGGVEPETIPDLKKMPLSGVAVLGGIWNYADPINAFIKLQRAVSGTLN